jgi:tetratricopeptide (TPR) repeat protein
MRFDRAKPQLEKALVMFHALRDEKYEAFTLYRLAELAAGEGRAEDAVKGYEHTLEHLRRMGKNAPPIAVFAAKVDLANTFSMMLNRRLPEAQALFDEAIALGNRDSSIPKVNVANAMGLRAVMLQNEGKMKQAEAMYREALAIGRREDPNGLWQGSVLFGLSIVIAPRDPAGAAELSRQRYELLASRRGIEDGHTAVAKILWIRQRAEAGELEDAAPQVLEAMEIVRKRYLPSSMNLWFALNSSAHVLNKAKRYAEAESLARELLPIFELNHVPDNDGRRAESLSELGEALVGEKKNREAAEVLNRSVAIYNASGSKFMAERVETRLRQIK